MQVETAADSVAFLKALLEAARDPGRFPYVRVLARGQAGGPLDRVRLNVENRQRWQRTS